MPDPTEAQQVSTTSPTRPAWRRALEPWGLLPLVLPLLLTLAVIPLARSASSPAPAPPAAEVTVDAPRAPVAGRHAPVLTSPQRTPRQAAPPPGAAPGRVAPAPAAPGRTAVRGTGTPVTAQVPEDAPQGDDDAVDDAVRCVEEATVTLSTASC